MTDALNLPLFLCDTRTYVHGADLFDALTGASQADGAARLRLVRIADKAIELRFDRPDLTSPDLCGFFEFTRQGSERAAWLRERPEERISNRQELMDSEAVEAAAFSASSAEVRRDSRFSVGKAGLILLVALLERLYPLDAWNLAEMNAGNAKAGGSFIRVAISRRIGKFVFASIAADGQTWGGVVLASTPYVEGADT